MPKVIDRYFQTDPWKIIENGFDPSYSRIAESVFTLANEYMAVRGYFDEGYGVGSFVGSGNGGSPVGSSSSENRPLDRGNGGSTVGSFFNGIYRKSSIPPQWCKGLPESECFLLESVDWLYTRIILDGELLDLAKCAFRDFKRTLNMKTGVLSREFIWELSGGKLFKLSFIRFLSMEISNIGCQRIIFEPLNFDGFVEVESCLDYSGTHGDEWSYPIKENTDGMSAFLGQAENIGQKIYSSFKLNLPDWVEAHPITDEKLIGVRYTLPIKKGVSVTVDKIVFNYTEGDGSVNPAVVWETGCRLAEESLNLSFDKLLAGHVEHWDQYWNKFDISINGDLEEQQNIRFCIFNLHQAYHGGIDTPAGLMSPADYGRTWWNTEAYIMPFYLFSDPEAARKLLEFRYHHLPQALERAIEVGCTGALYPLTTVDGTESCVWWEHSQLQIHVSAVVAYGIWHYVHVSNDKEFLYDQGIEMLLQISRYYASRGRFNQSGESFGLYGVMGADELNMMVHNNFYTNMLVKKAFEYTLCVMDEMKVGSPDKQQAAVRKVGLKDNETDDWRLMMEKMRILLDEETGIYEQHDGAFDLPHIDVKTVQKDQLPVEDFWAYDRIFRYDMSRQPEVLLLMLLHSRDYSLETKRVNYEYYEPRCSHESPLSPSIHSILAAEIGDFDKAYEYLQVNLDIYSRYAGEGFPGAVFAANWLNIVYGYGGLRSDGEKLILEPSIPKGWDSFGFCIEYRGVKLRVEVSQKSVCVKTLGDPVPVIVYGKELSINVEGVILDMPASRLRSN